ncbi:hypothetical protein KHQ82_00770 [Mycoplasmatota bacterium]|nr:hypothetical protein KHQ82_00770 [Mycoplasmatota bacterium]
MPLDITKISLMQKEILKYIYENMTAGNGLIIREIKHRFGIAWIIIAC